MRIFILLLFILINNYQLSSAQITFPPLNKKQIEEDLQIYKLALEAHPGLDIYRTDAELRQWKNRLNDLPKDQITLDSFYLALSEHLTYIHDGHTSLLLGDNYGIIKENRYVLPFEYIILDEKLYITHNYDTSGLIPTFSEILTVNEIEVADALAIMYKHTKTDGYPNLPYKRQYNQAFFGENFNFFFKQTRRFLLEYRTPDGDTLSSYIRGIRNLKRLKELHEPKSFYAEFKKEEELGILTINTFNYKTFMERGEDFFAFIHNFFQEARKEKIKYLVIDLRKNYGGTSLAALALYSYLNTGRFKWMENNRVKLAKLKALETYAQNFDNVYQFIQTQDSLQLDAEYYSLSNGTDNKSSYSCKKTLLGRNGKIKHKNICKNCFDEEDRQIFILTSGLTFSAATIFASKCKYDLDVTIIGQPTGGSAHTFCAGKFLRVVLPHSRFVFLLPAIRRQIAVPKTEDMHIQADIKVDYTIEDIMQQKDLELETVLQILDNKKESLD